MSAATNCPPCPECKVEVGSIAFAKDMGFARGIGCAACGHVWNGTAEERARARAADEAYEAEQASDHARGEAQLKARRDRARVVELFKAAGKPVPAWVPKESRS